MSRPSLLRVFVSYVIVNWKKSDVRIISTTVCKLDTERKAGESIAGRSASRASTAFTKREKRTNKLGVSGLRDRGAARNRTNVNYLIKVIR